MDIQKIISLLTKTQEFIKNREMAAHVKEKGLADYVTQVDIAVQNFLKKELFALAPDIQFLGEETGLQEIKAVSYTHLMCIRDRHQSGMMSKQDAYQWLADLICAPLSEAHIGHLGEYYCKQVIEESRRLMERRKSGKKRYRFRALEGGVAAS